MEVKNLTTISTRKCHFEPSPFHVYTGFVFGIFRIFWHGLERFESKWKHCFVYAVESLGFTSLSKTDGGFVTQYYCGSQCTRTSASTYILENRISTYKRLDFLDLSENQSPTCPNFPRPFLTENYRKIPSRIARFAESRFHHGSADWKNTSK